VNLSETTYKRVQQFIECEPRGHVKIKEGREMEMYFAVGPKEDLLRGETVNGIPEAFRAAYEQAFGEPPKSFPAAAVLEELMNSRFEVTPSDPK
jgi:adenylate cyclase